jgi:hypothetical protein
MKLRNQILLLWRRSAGVQPVGESGVANLKLLQRYSSPLTVENKGDVEVDNTTKSIRKGYP